MKKLFVSIAMVAFIATVAIPTNSFAGTQTPQQEKKDEKKCEKSGSKDKKEACCAKDKQDAAAKSDAQKAK